MTMFLIVVLVALVAVNTAELARLRERVEDLEGEKANEWCE